MPVVGLPVLDLLSSSFLVGGGTIWIIKRYKCFTACLLVFYLPTAYQPLLLLVYGTHFLLSRVWCFALLLSKLLLLGACWLDPLGSQPLSAYRYTNMTRFHISRNNCFIESLIVLLHKGRAGLKRLDDGQPARLVDLSEFQ